MYDESTSIKIAHKIEACWHKRVCKLQFVATNAQGTLFLATNVFGDKVAFRLVEDKVERLSLVKVLAFLGKAPSDDLLK